MDIAYNEAPFYVLFSAVTHHPFIHMDPETREVRAFIFETEKLFNEGAEDFLEERHPLMKVALTKREKKEFFNLCSYLGIDTFVSYRADGILTFKLGDVFLKREFMNLPGGKGMRKGEVINPSLQSTILFFAQALNREVSPAEKRYGISAYNKKLEEGMRKSTLLAPVIPKEGSNEYGLVIFNDANGGQWMPVFTDHMEYDQFNKENKFMAIRGTLKELTESVVDRLSGIIVNTNSVSLQIQKQLLDRILKVEE